jgi:TolB-like protein
MSFFNELKRRNVVRVGIAYVVASWLVAQVLELAADSFGAPEWVMKMVLIVLAIGLPVVLFLSWALELTPEGIKKEKDVDRSQSITPQTGKKLNNTILVLMAVAITYLLFDKFSEKGSEPYSQTSSSQSAQDEEKRALTPFVEPAITRQSIAVLPFDNRSNREEDQFFTDGIHDDLLTTIARIGSMKVISRTSVMEYKNTTKKLPQIAKELGVANILEGGIQRSGNQVRINVQLIDASTDEHLWAEIFDRELTAENLFAIQSEISKAIARSLQATLSPEEERRIDTNPTDNLVALEAYLQGRQLMATRETAKLESAIEQFNKAVILDPEFALAWVGVADSNYLLSLYGTFPTDKAVKISKDAIDRALGIDNELGEAYASLGKKAVELNPNYASTYQWYASLVGNDPLRINERMELIKKAVELDPRSEIIMSNLGYAYLDRGLYSLAERQWLKMIEQNPESKIAHRNLADLNSYNLGRFDIALSYSLKAVELDPNGMWLLRTLSNIYMDLGDWEAVESVRNRMAELDANHQHVGLVDIRYNIYRNNHAGARESINWVMPKFADDPWGLMFRASELLTVGDVHRAKDIYLSTAPGWLDPDQWQDLLRLYGVHGCVFSWVLINTGDVELGHQLLDQSTDYLVNTLPTVDEHADWYAPELCHLTAGDTDKALQAIETYLSHNHLAGWPEFHQMPMYNLIRHEPRYQAALAERERRIEVQREAIEAGGKL